MYVSLSVDGPTTSGSRLILLPAMPRKVGKTAALRGEEMIESYIDYGQGDGENSIPPLFLTAI